MRKKKILRVDGNNARLYIAYANTYGREHDESFLPADDFLPDDENPAFLLVDPEEPDHVLGVCGLMLDRAFLEAKRGRFTILHARNGNVDDYRLLREAALEKAEKAGISGGFLYGFLPARLGETARVWQSLGLYEERRAYLLSRDSSTVPDPRPPEGFYWATVRSDDEKSLEAWRGLINRNFRERAGHVELSLEKTRKMAAAEMNVGEGLEMLVGPSGPVGTIQVEPDEEDPEAGFLGAICVSPEYRGRGLGRLILRHGLAVSRQAGLETTWLSVNAENENAIRLYISEGFKEERVMVCHSIEVQ